MVWKRCGQGFDNLMVLSPALVYRKSRVIHAMAYFPGDTNNQRKHPEFDVFYPSSRVKGRYLPENLAKSPKSDYIFTNR